MKDNDIGPKVSRSTLYRLLRDLGYRSTVADRRAHMTETENIRAWRRRFIQRLNANEQSEEPKPVIYLDESWIDCNSTAKKGWRPKVIKTRRDKLDYSLKMKCGKGARLIMLHAGI